VARALADERRKQARRINAIRFAGVSGFFVLALVMDIGLGAPAWHGDLHLFAAYWLATALLFFLVRRFDRLAGLATFAIAFVDVPVVFFLQLATFPTSPSTSGVAGFTVGIYALLVMLAAFSLDGLQIGLTAASAAAFEIVLQIYADVGLGARISSALLLSLVALACVYASRRLVTLVHHVVDGLARDEAARKQLQAKLMMTDRLVAMGQLAAGIAHEIRNPLNYVTGNIDLIKMEIDGVRTKRPDLHSELASTQQMLAEAEHGARRIKGIVDDMQTFSRAGDVHKAAKVQEVIASSLNIAAGEIRNHAKIIQEIDAVADVALDPGRLGQVILNLLINAAHATAERAKEGTIRVSARQEGARVVIAVSDSGSGMPPEVKARLFEPFFTTKPEGQGTGLGLSICHSIVSEAGGEITVDSEPGRGTTFSVSLPAAAPPPV
jgi:signal transduction histidine kinase